MAEDFPGIYESTEVVNDSPRALRDRWHGDHARYDDLVWHDVAQTNDERRPPLGPFIEDDKKRPRGNLGAHGRKKREADGPKDLTWLLGKVGEAVGSLPGLPLAVPETVVIEKGRPQKMYFLDPEATRNPEPGRLQVYKSTRHDLNLGGLMKTFYKLHKKRWYRRLRDYTARAFPDSRPTGDELEALREASDMVRLTHVDGAVRILSAANVRKMITDRQFTRQFWQQVAILQTIPWIEPQYISYRFSSVGVDQRDGTAGATAPDVQKIPPILREHLLSRMLDLRSGTFEFVRDGVDGMLWLSYASRIRCIPVVKIPDPGYGTSEEQLLAKRVRYFREGPFLDMLSEHESKLHKFGEAEETISCKERQTMALDKFREMDSLAGVVMADDTEQVEEEQKIIPLFMGTNPRELREWFRDASPMDKEDQVVEVVSALFPEAGEGGRRQTELLPPPGSQPRFQPQALSVQLGRVAAKERPVHEWARGLVNPGRDRSMSLLMQGDLLGSQGMHSHSDILQNLGSRSVSPTKSLGGPSRASTPSSPLGRSASVRMLLSSSATSLYGTLDKAVSRPGTQTSSRSLMRTASSIF